MWWSKWDTRKLEVLVGSLSNLTLKLPEKLQKTCVAVKGIIEYVGHTGSVLSGMITCVKQEGEKPEFISCSVMRKAEGLGIGCEMSWHVASNGQQSAVYGWGGQQPNTPRGTEHQLPVGAGCAYVQIQKEPFISSPGFQLSRTGKKH